MARASSASRTCSAGRSHSEYTAMVRMPISRHARMMRTAISPRLAMRILFNGARAFGLASVFYRLERYVAVLLRRVLVALVVEVFQGGNQPPAGIARPDDFVDEATAGRNIRVGELLPELRHLVGASRGRIARRIELPLVQ